MENTFWRDRSLDRRAIHRISGAEGIRWTRNTVAMSRPGMRQILRCLLCVFSVPVFNFHGGVFFLSVDGRCDIMKKIRKIFKTLGC